MEPFGEEDDCQLETHYTEGLGLVEELKRDDINVKFQPKYFTLDKTEY